MNESTLPLVSIGLPTFNRADRLRTAIESALAQDYLNIELVISDNASSDATAALCNSFTALDDRIKYFRQPTNCGMTANFREVLSKAAGVYFMWLSDDDHLDPTYVSRCMNLLVTRDDISLVCGVARYTDDDGSEFQGVKVDLEASKPFERVVEYYRKVNDNGTFYGIMRRESVMRFPLRHELGGDWMLLASLAYIGRIITIDDVVVYRSSGGASANVRSLARTFGVSSFGRWQPHLLIAFNAMRDVLYRSSAFRGIGVVRRISLAAKCGYIIFKRFVEFENPMATLTRRVGRRLQRALTPG